MSKAIREAEKRARERERERKPFEELRMAAKVKPTPIERGSSNPTEGILTLEEEEKLFRWIYGIKPQPSGAEINAIYGKWLTKKKEIRR